MASEQTEDNDASSEDTSEVATARTQSTTRSRDAATLPAERCALYHKLACVRLIHFEWATKPAEPGWRRFCRRVGGLCKMAGIVCCLVCPPVPTLVAAKIAFQPPPRSYDFVRADGKRYRRPPSSRNRRLNFGMVGRAASVAKVDRRLQCFYAPTQHGSYIACAYVCETERPRFTILLSQPNASDLGQFVLDSDQWPTMRDASAFLRCAVFCYDYTGYGMSTGRRRLRNLSGDARAALAELRRRYEPRAQRIILWGISMGTAASVLLATELQGLAAIMLVAPFASASHMVADWCECADKSKLLPDDADQLDTLSRIGRVRCPTLLIHGDKDDVVPPRHSLLLHAALHPDARLPPVWIENGGHCDVMARYRFWLRLRSFVDQLTPPSVSD